MLATGSPSQVKFRKSRDKSDKRHGMPAQRHGMPSGSGSGSVGQELQHLEKERTIQTDPGETRRRRTIRLVRQDVHGCWGFTLQTYGIRHKHTGEVEVMTYVDYVELSSAAWIAGMRKGDVLLSVNGESVEGLNHDMLVAKIHQCHDVLRLVVLFEDCCRKVDLYERFIRLKRILARKKLELSQLEHREKVLCSGGLLSPVGFSRDSMRSSTSSDWDRYSEVACPAALEPAALEPAALESAALEPAALEPAAPNQATWQPHPGSPDPDTRAIPAAPPRHPASSENGPSTCQQTSAEDSSSDGSGIRMDATGGHAENPPDEGLGEEPQSSDTSPVLRRRSARKEEEGEEASPPASSEDESSESEAEPPPVCRMRSNSIILNEMRMRLLADIVCHEASAAVGLLEEEEEEEEEESMEGDSHLGELSDSEVIVEVEEDEEDKGEERDKGKEEEEEEEEREDSEDEEMEEEEGEKWKKDEREEEKEIKSGEKEEDMRNEEKEEEKEKADSPGRLCRGVRVNDNDEVTRL